jgi:transposase
VALAAAGKRREVREYGKIANTPAAVKALIAKLARNGHELRFCYEAGPCGYGIQRQLTASEHDCIVVAPSLILRRPGERIRSMPTDSVLTQARKKLSDGRQPLLPISLMPAPPPLPLVDQRAGGRANVATSGLSRHRAVTTRVVARICGAN